MQSQTVRRVLIFGALCIIGIVLLQIYWVRKAFDLKEKQFSQTVNIALLEVADQLFKYNNITFPNESPVKEISPDYFVVNVNSVIDADILEHYLRTHFQYHTILTDFEYAIYDCSSDKMVYGDYISFSKQPKETPRARNLRKLDQYTYYFGVYFPHKNSYLVGDLGIWIASSLVFLVAIIFITYAMFVILRQKRLADVQKDFLDNMTHEFKTPIATIAVAADVLSKPNIAENPDRIQSYSGIIREENSRLQEQVEKLLAFSSTEKGSLELKKSTVDLHTLIAKTVNSFNLKLNDCLKADLQADFALIEADEFHLTNVLYNLIDNAIKYTETSPKVVIRTYNIPEGLVAEIADNGIGIPPEEQKKIFRKFYRVPTGNVHNVKGFGLGLNYVQQVVKAHKWKLELRANTPSGCIFTITFRS